MVAIVFWSLIALGIVCGIALSAAATGGMFWLGVATGSERLRGWGETAWRHAVRVWTVAIVAFVAVTVAGLLSFFLVR